MRDRIKAAAEANNRSMNAEIVATLEEKYPAPPEHRPGYALTLFARAEVARRNYNSSDNEAEREIQQQAYDDAMRELRTLLESGSGWGGGDIVSTGDGDSSGRG